MRFLEIRPRSHRDVPLEIWQTPASNKLVYVGSRWWHHLWGASSLVLLFCHPHPGQGKMKDNRHMVSLACGSQEALASSGQRSPEHLACPAFTQTRVQAIKVARDSPAFHYPLVHAQVNNPISAVLTFPPIKQAIYHHPVYSFLLCAQRGG